MKKGTTKGRGGRSKQPPKVPPPKVQLPIVPDISGMTYDQINSLGDDIRDRFSQEQEEYYQQLEEAEAQRQVAEIAEAQKLLKPTDKHPKLINFNDTPYDQIIFNPPENPYNPKQDPLRWRLYENKTLDFKRRRREARTDLDIKRLQDDMDEFYEGEFDWDPNNAHQNDEVVRTMKTISNMRAFNQANDEELSNCARKLSLFVKLRQFLKEYWTSTVSPLVRNETIADINTPHDASHYGSIGFV